MNLNIWGCCTDCLYEFVYMEKGHTKISTYSNEMNTYKDFHAFTYISMKIQVFTTIKYTTEYSNIQSSLFES